MLVEMLLQVLEIQIEQKSFTDRSMILELSEKLTSILIGLLIKAHVLLNRFQMDSYRSISRMNEDTAFVGWDSEFAAISLNQEPSRMRSCFESMLKDPQIKIVTNNGKQVAKAFLSCGLPACEIIDVIITEKLIANGEADFHVMNLKTVFKTPRVFRRVGTEHGGHKTC